MKVVTHTIKPNVYNGLRKPTERRGIEFTYRLAGMYDAGHRATGCLLFAAGPRVTINQTTLKNVVEDTPAADLRVTGILQVGGKTLLRALEKALDGNDLELNTKHSDAFRMRREGRVFIVRAPCGARARVTVIEVENIVAALRAELYPS